MNDNSPVQIRFALISHTNNGKTTIDNIGSIKSGQNAIYVDSATGAVDIGRGTPIGPITAAGRFPPSIDLTSW